MNDTSNHDTRTDAQDERGERLVGMRWLSVAYGRDRGLRRVVDAEPIAIGRAPEGDASLVLADPGVSKRHAELTIDASTGAVLLLDGGSRNGTFVNGVRRERAELAHGDVVRVGATLLLYEEAAVEDDDALDPPDGILEGPSLAMQRARREIRRFAAERVPALVIGESGVGKELVAVDIHRQSRRPGPLVAVNCAAISSSVAESEMFGHTAGAFTGALKRHHGFFAAAAGGTLLLDEIGEMALELQAKLLRAIAVGEVRPVGSSQAEQVDVRVVAATHVDLDAAVAQGRFRGDLLARLRGWTLRIPPLRERREDILALACRFLQQRPGAARLDREGLLSADAAEALLLHHWPYNVRDLEQVVTVAAVTVPAGEPLRLTHLPSAIAAPIRARSGARAASSPAPLALLVSRDRAPTRDELEHVLARLDGNMAEAATFFGKDRRQIYRWAERLGVEPERFRCNRACSPDGELPTH